MCLILFRFQPGSKRPFVVAANRDEFYERASAPAHYWQDTPAMLAGKDLQAGGTWLGVTRDGRFAAITNIREPGVVVENALSRGELTRSYLQNDYSAKEYMERVSDQRHLYSGFNLLVGELRPGNETLYFLNNREGEVKRLQAGVFGLSNDRLDTPWPKVVAGKQFIETDSDRASEDLHQILREKLENPEQATDEELPATGVSYELEKALSATFIHLPHYGTRTTTVISVDDGLMRFSECNYLPSSNNQPNPAAETAVFEWSLG